MNSSPPNVALAAVYARYFLRHLREELEKPAELLDRMTAEGRSFRATTEQLIGAVIREFPGLETAEAAPYNLFRRWSEMAPTPELYDQNTYIKRRKRSRSQREISRTSGARGWINGVLPEVRPAETVG